MNTSNLGLKIARAQTFLLNVTECFCEAWLQPSLHSQIVDLNADPDTIDFIIIDTVLI